MLDKLINDLSAPGLWIGLILGTMLAIIPSLVAGYYLEPVRQWIDGRRTLYRLRSLDKERDEYGMILALLNHPEAMVLLITKYIFVIATMLGGFVLMTAALVIRTIEKSGSEPVALSQALATFGLLAVGSLTLASGAYLHSRFARYINNFSLFTLYRASLIKKWPNEFWPLSLDELDCPTSESTRPSELWRRRDEG